MQSCDAGAKRDAGGAARVKAARAVKQTIRICSNGCSSVLAAIAALLLLAMVALVTADIVLRNTLRIGFPWANEVTEYALYLTTLLTAPWLLRRGQHVRIDMVLVLVPPRVAWLMEAAADMLGLAASLVLVWYGTHHDGAERAARLAHHQEPGVSRMVAALRRCRSASRCSRSNSCFRFHRLMGAPRTRRIEATSVG